MRRAVEPDFAELEREMARQIESGLRPIAADRGRLSRGELVFERALGRRRDGRLDLRAVELDQAARRGRAAAARRRGPLALDDRVAKHFPEFGAHGKERSRSRTCSRTAAASPTSTPASCRASWRSVSRDWNAALRFVCDMELALGAGHRPRLPPALGAGSWSASWCSDSTAGRSPTRCARACSSRSAIPRDGFALGRPQDLAAPPLTVQTRDAKGAPTAARGRLLERPAHARGGDSRRAAGSRARAALAAFYRALLDGGPRRERADPVGRDGAHARPSRTWSASATAPSCATCRGDSACT